ncbi:glycine--tRNA ligase [Candidatus Woesearchaeota archaeon]|nr:glycine--tRNA ligase [Candidatus Woesearchaeota archaeon]
MASQISIDEIAIFCKKKGFVYPSSEIYGGMAGFFDFGPLGVELLNNIKASWWKYFVQDREDVVGIDGSIIAHPHIWKASGHVDNFGDLALICSKCRNRVRADHFIEDVLQVSAAGMKGHDINAIVKEKKLSCPLCKGRFEELKNFNLLFSTTVGAEQEKGVKAYLRGETAQNMFVDFRIITETNRVKLPFGIAQIGKCFRNEISPRDFMFRSREFTIAEVEFFILPDVKTCGIFTSEHRHMHVKLLDAQTQEQGKTTPSAVAIQQMIKDGRIDEWHAYWLAEQMCWLISLGLKKDDLKIREHVKTELSHYSTATFDIDYAYPFGSKELAGNANRGQHDLSAHMRASKEKLELFDEESKSKVIPRVIEPTFGMERTFLAVLCDAYHDDKKRGNIVLKLHPKLAPVKVAIFPLVNKDGLEEKAREVHAMLRRQFTCVFDRSGSVGRRYARNDEIGTPYCITVDHDTLQGDSVTIRDRDTTEQVRVSIKELQFTLLQLIEGHLSFENLQKKEKKVKTGKATNIDK